MIGTFRAAFGFLKGLTDAALAFFRKQEREEHRQAGRNEQELENRDAVDAAEDRMDAVKPATEKETVDALKGGKF